MSKPSILFFPGSFVLVSLYQPIFDAVSEAGYEIKGIHLPSVGPSSRQGRDGPAPSMYDDAAMVAQEAERLADQGKDVIIIAHSYGGVPVSQAPRGLGKDERKAQGKPGGVVRLAYMTCLVPAIGKSAMDVLSSMPESKPPSTSIDENGWALQEDPAGTARLILQHLSPEEGEAIVRDFAKHSATCFVNELTYAGYKDIPVSYLVCEDDLIGSPEMQRAGIDMIEQVSGRKVDVTSIKSGHCPNLAAKKETIDWILSVAKKAQES
ncbi:hypothetical protein LTR99_009405 [Exophiala xenobiotica]|uniref:AB hydrolase-1 domain-containing protein n=1 Tax=Vermiconidia calcicola TaxID=1690605 RepID=A0AAV9PX81_9PEZI|nr:hypothetical protein LTR92_002232 [Exophiala xenobiotica]KAK5530920.1 hypothetical protein LTR25_008777 [Vermiconidia calcicola]KAK5544412.1 hypothetical protein LTR23_004500 [Chaetothyriales sp. CCFEE 6169]KAK5269037.1 hypothetical protein LTR96_005821 [Exophiala xenobiotica]KAK5294599.1 hypothetical protein LTR99_009405 [Exophiala xenobiotica]